MMEKGKGPATSITGNRGGTLGKAVPLTAESLVTAEPLGAAESPPVLIQPAVPGIDLTAWTRNNREILDRHLRTTGAILFRGFVVESMERFEEFMTSFGSPLLEYKFGSTPRSHVSGNVYTSTEYPADQEIPLHNEMSYSHDWPLKIWFRCVEAASEGGETPIADSRKVYERLEPNLRERLAKKQVMYVRNYWTGLDVPWQQVFETSDRQQVEMLCRQAGAESKWLGEDHLRTREVRQAVARHPKTGEMVWFNQAHLFHVSAISPEIRDVLLSTYKEAGLPRNVYYGDGSAIEPSILAEIREAYRAEAVVFRWKSGDVLMLDNMLTAHGRKPFSGPRRVVVGMAESHAATKTVDAPK
jgi:alpha-ketoglutarate-dependent taurine dioxygenase